MQGLKYAPPPAKYPFLRKMIAKKIVLLWEY